VQAATESTLYSTATKGIRQWPTRVELQLPSHKEKSLDRNKHLLSIQQHGNAHTKSRQHCTHNNESQSNKKQEEANNFFLTRTA